MPTLRTELPLTLPYATHVELDFARARALAALVTGPAGALLSSASSGNLLLGVLGLLCVVAALAWVAAARRGRARARARAEWRLGLDHDALVVSTPHGDQRVSRESVDRVSLDEDRLEVVVAAADGEVLRLEATWGPYGVVDLHALLRSWWRGEGARGAPETPR